MRVEITQGYTDSQLNRIVYAGEELSVSESRAKRLIDGKVAKAVSEDMDDYKARIKELETALKAKK